MNAQTSASWLNLGSGVAWWGAQAIHICLDSRPLCDGRPAAYDVEPVVTDPNAMDIQIHRVLGPLPNMDDSLIYRAFSLASLVSIVIASSFVYRDIAKLLARNGAIIAYISFIMISAVWSMHPDITLRRGLGCILTILVAAYLVVRFDEKDRMKLFSFVFVIPAIVSLFALHGRTGSL